MKVLDITTAVSGFNKQDLSIVYTLFILTQSSWILDVQGKTKKEVNKAGYICEDSWLCKQEEYKELTKDEFKNLLTTRIEEHIERT